MKFEMIHDEDANAVYVKTGMTPPASQEEIVSFSATVLIDRDAHGDIVGVEVI